ncbi:MAG: LURP-one-related family protein [Clostridia bacterium]|nr:LURP-one-related family protein [Clostridia bacterium]MBQ9513797.1 LURP-one-related family protein [Clostridia bacterium]
MILNVKNNLVTLKGGSKVTDENGNELLKVKGVLSSITNKKIIADNSGKKVFLVRNKYWHLFNRSAYIYDKEGAKLLKITQKYFQFRKFKVVDYTSDSIWSIEGPLHPRDITVKKDDVKLGVIHDNFDFIKDTFSVDAEENYEYLMVAICIAIDNIYDATRKSK